MTRLPLSAAASDNVRRAPCRPALRHRIIAGTQQQFLRRGATHMRLETARDEFMLYKRAQRRAPKTIRTYTTYVNAFIGHVEYQTRTQTTTHMTATMMTSFFVHLLDSKLSHNTVNLAQTALREFARWGLRRRYWTEDAFADVPLVKKPVTLPRPYHPDERDRLLSLPLRGEQAVLRGLLYYLGLRAGECVAIQLKDIREPGDTLGRIYIHGKGARERVRPIPAEFWPVLHDYVLTKLDLDPRAFLLSQANGPWKTRKVERYVALWGKAAGVIDCLSHRFRHTFASDMLDLGVDIRDVQDALGHASLANTQIYTLVTNDRRDEAARRLGEARNPGTHYTPTLAQTVDSWEA